MALTDSQRKAPHRPISQRNYTSYLERSFEEGRLDEMQEWWDLGLVQKTLQASDDKGTTTSHHHHLMQALAKGIGYAAVPASWWDKMLEVGGDRYAAGQSVGWLAHWAARPDMLERATQYGYSMWAPYGTYTSSNNHSMWQTLLIRALDTYGLRKPSAQECARLLDFLEKRLDPVELAKASPEHLGEALDTLMWKASFSAGAQAQRFERWSNALIEAGADCKLAFARWCGSHYGASQADPAWPRIGVKLAQSAAYMDYNAMSGLVKNPQGLSVAQAAWAAGAQLYPSYKSNFGDSKTHWTMGEELWKERRDRGAHQPEATAWLNALADIAAQRATPPPDDWMQAVLKSWGEAYPKSDFTPEQFETWLPQCAAMVRLIQQAGAPSANVQYAFSNNLARAGFDTWEVDKRQRWWATLDAALEGGMGNWWGQHVNEVRVRRWWWKEMTQSPERAAALASTPDSPWPALTWHALVDRSVVSEALIKDPTFWEADSAWKTLSAGVAATLDKVQKRVSHHSSETALGKAISEGEFLLAHALLDNGSRLGLDAEGLWTSFASMARNGKHTLPAVELLDKLVFHGAKLDVPDRPRNSLLVSLLKNPEVDPVLVRAVHAHGADFSVLESLGLQGQSEGHRLAHSLPRETRLSEVLGEQAPVARSRPRM